MSNELCIVEDLEILHETDAAILVSIGEGQNIWLPKSKIDYDGGVGDTIDVEMPEWLALEKGLI